MHLPVSVIPSAKRSVPDVDLVLCRHKCPDGISCTLGDHCRFASIPEAHPDSRDFPKKKTYYDGSKGGQSGRGQADGNGWYDGNSDESDEVDFSAR
jgi:hypothetical protein